MRSTELMMMAGAMSGVADMYEYADMPKVKYTRGTSAKVRDSKTDPKIGRNQPCPCGSGKKYKKCCALAN